MAFFGDLGQAVLRWLQGGGPRRPRVRPEPPWPANLPRVAPREFFFRWARRLLRTLGLRFRRASAPKPAGAAEAGGAHALSLRVAAAINLFYWPFFWTGILLLAWFPLDLALGVLAPALRERLLPGAEIALALGGPAAVGYWTNWIAIKMLFHPRRKNAIWQGLIPARRAELIESISDGVLQRLISPEIVRDYLRQTDLLKTFVHNTLAGIKETVDHPQFRREIKGLVYGLIHDFATSEATRRSVEELFHRKIATWTGETLGEKIVEWTKALWGPMVLKEVLNALPEVPRAMDNVLVRLDEALDNVPRFIERESGNLEDTITRAVVEGLRGLDIKHVVRQQLDRMDERELERMLTGHVTTELKFIQTSGGVLGLLAGTAFVFPAVRPFLLAAAAGLWLVYRATSRS
jgi:uncharacterized membrane-anchored protein YjiN (DUF445 family)